MDESPSGLLYVVCYLLDKVYEQIQDKSIKERVKTLNIEVEKIFDLLETETSKENKKKKNRKANNP